MSGFWSQQTDITDIAMLTSLLLKAGDLLQSMIRDLLKSFETPKASFEARLKLCKRSERILALINSIGLHKKEYGSYKN